MDDYVSSEEVKYGRPYPYMIYKLMIDNDIDNVQSVIKFGDTKNDILEGLNSNCISTVGVLSGAGTREDLKKGNYILNNIMDIE